MPAQVIQELYEVEHMPRYLVQEERQLTHFLRQNLLTKLPPPFMVTNTSTFASRPSYIFLCEYDRLRPDLCIFTDKSTGVLVTERESIDGLTIEGKRNEFAMAQCIANMIQI